MTGMIERRAFLRAGLTTVTGIVASPFVIPGARALAEGCNVRERTLHMHHIHTGEKFTGVFKVGNTYIPDALTELSHFMRDWRTGQAHTMDPALYDLIHDIYACGGSQKPFEIVCGYRSPQTNGKLRSARGGGIAKDSQHIYGRAVDLYLPGTPLVQLRRAAVDCGKGGVGHYPRSGFIHVDTRGYPAQWGARA